MRLEKHGVYELVPLPSGPFCEKLVGTRWVNKIKVDGSLKGHLVVQEWSQVPGIDYGSTFPPVCRLQSTRMMLWIAAGLDYEIYFMRPNDISQRRSGEGRFRQDAPGCELSLNQPEGRTRSVTNLPKVLSCTLGRFFYTT